MLDFNKVIYQSDEDDLTADNKSKLQHFVQKNKLGEITYEKVAVSGPPHQPIFTMAVAINGNQIASAQGKSHKKAEQLAANKALQILTNKE